MSEKPLDPCGCITDEECRLERSWECVLRDTRCPLDPPPVVDPPQEWEEDILP